MSSASTPTDSPIIQPMHNPAQAALVQQPQAPLGNSTNGLLLAPGQGTRAMLAKRLASKTNPKYISPTDNMMTPCTAKISQSKKKHFNKGKPVQLFQKREPTLEQPVEEIPSNEAADTTEPSKCDAMVVDNENPF